MHNNNPEVNNPTKTQVDEAIRAVQTSSAYSDVPQKLKSLPNWVVWRYEKRNGKETKVPYDTKGKFAKSNAPSTWSSFQAAVAAADPFTGGNFNGIGFMLYGTPLVGIDFDGCVDDGVPEPFVMNIISQLGNPYVEVTPSGTGLRVFVECPKLPPGTRKVAAKKKGCEKYGAEIYAGSEGGRYLTMTGDRLSGEGIPTVENLEIVHFLISRFADDHFKKLWMGDSSDYENDDSRVDLALLGCLARAFGADREKMEKFFSASVPGHREKWTSRKDYRERTLNVASSGNTSQESDGSQYEPTSCTADQIEPKPVVWLWPERFAQKLNLIVGNPDVGKGLISHYLVTCVTTGKAWFDAENTLPPSEALILSAEEDWDDTVVPRLMAAGADLSKVHKLKMSATRNGTKLEKELSLDRDSAVLDEFLHQHPAIRLVVIDPISNYLGAVKMIDEQRVREILTPLKEMANRRQVAVVGIMHLNKKVELDAIHRIGGAMAFVGVARMVWLCAPKPNEDGSDSDESVMVKVKGNIVHRKLKGMSYTTKVRYPEIMGKPTKIPYVEWIGAVDKTADDLVGGSTKQKNPAHRPADQLEEAIAWLTALLRDGAVPLDDIEHEGKVLHGFSQKTIQRARRAVGVVTFSSGKRQARDGKMRDSYSCKLPHERIAAATEVEYREAF